jgi:hypothetical protein
VQQNSQAADMPAGPALLTERPRSSSRESALLIELTFDAAIDHGTSGALETSRGVLDCASPLALCSSKHIESDLNLPAPRRQNCFKNTVMFSTTANKRQ